MWPGLRWKGKDSTVPSEDADTLSVPAIAGSASSPRSCGKQVAHVDGMRAPV